MSQLSRFIPTSGPGSGTVTSITFNGGLTSTPDPVTTTGTATIDQTNLTILDGTVYWDTGTKLLHTTATGTAGQVLTSNGVGLAPSYQNASASLTFDGDSGTATPSAGVIHLLGGNNITSAAAGSTVAYALTGTTNHDVQIGNASGSLTSVPNGTTGQVLTAQTGADPIWASASGGGITTIDVDNGGSVTGSTIDLFANTGSASAGSSVMFTAASATEINLQVTDVNGNTIIGLGSGNATTSIQNTVLGSTNFDAATSDSGSNVAIGFSTLSSLTSGNGNNVAVGSGSLENLSSGGNNVGIGTRALGSLPSGSFNVAIGNGTATSYTGSESSNISINVTGSATAGENNTLRIGDATGTSPQFLSQAFISGINGNALGGSSLMVIIDSGTDQLGTAALPTSGITTINVDNGGSITGSTIDLFANSGSANAGSSVKFIAASGTEIDLQLSDANNNIMLGLGAGSTGLTGSNNVTVGINNFINLTTGSTNVGLGFGSGFFYTGAESNNILFNNFGTVGESNTLSIGSGTGTGSQQLSRAFISGINGITVTGSAVLVSSTNQLGIAVSSRKYKENIQDLGDISSGMLKLRPVSFNYIVGNDDSQQTGLIAEEVAEIMPSLVIYDQKDEPQTVKYHDLPVLLLNELQKALKRIEVLESKLGVK